MPAAKWNSLSSRQKVYRIYLIIAIGMLLLSIMLIPLNRTFFAYLILVFAALFYVPLLIGRFTDHARSMRQKSMLIYKKMLIPGMISIISLFFFIFMAHLIVIASFTFYFVLEEYGMVVVALLLVGALISFVTGLIFYLIDVQKDP